MNDPTPNLDPKNKGRTMYDEADIGSGERSPGQQETEEMIRGIPSLPKSNGESDEGRQDGGKESNADSAEPQANRQGTPGV